MPTEREAQVIRAAMAAGIVSRKELANFMGQVGHESFGLTRLEEGFRYTHGIGQISVVSARRHGIDRLESARVEALHGRPEELAELMYGGRMGNNNPGDGYRYRGRGYIQLTGKNTYRQIGDAMGLDLVNQPDLVSSPEYATRIAIAYWKINVPPEAREDVPAATHAINNGINGLADRTARYADWHKVLTPEFLAKMSTETTLNRQSVSGPHSIHVPSPAEPSHPDHTLYQQARTGVHRLDRELDRKPDAVSERMAASLLLLAKENGLNRIDHVILSVGNGTTRQGENVVIVQGRLDDPVHRRAHMKTQSAIDTPVAESFQKVEAMNLAQQQQSQLSQSRLPAIEAHLEHAAYREGPRLVPMR